MEEYAKCTICGKKVYYLKGEYFYDDMCEDCAKDDMNYPDYYLYDDDEYYLEKYADK